ncbi:MAG TPA: type I methionyl aminopeptidase [Bacillota bacterium]
MITIKSAREIEKMRRAGRVVAEVLERLRAEVRPGITTGELDRIAERLIRARGARPAFKGYHGFPASICTSINDEVVHGIPGDRTLREGDIISIDVGAVLDGYYGDAAVTLPVGRIPPTARRLLEVTEQALYAGIAAAREDARLTDISHAVQTAVERHGFSVVRDYVGHGIGQQMHEEPQVPNYGPPGLGPVLKRGMTLAIEPMVNVGDYAVETKADRWTVVTRDGSLSAHFEHTIAITAGAAEILTRLE